MDPKEEERKRLKMSYVQELNDLCSLCRKVIHCYTHIPFTRTIIYTFLTMNKCVYKDNFTTSKDEQQRNQCIIKNLQWHFCVTVFYCWHIFSFYRQL